MYILFFVVLLLISLAVAHAVPPIVAPILHPHWRWTGWLSNTPNQMMHLFSLFI